MRRPSPHTNDGGRCLPLLLLLPLPLIGCGATVPLPPPPPAAPPPAAATVAPAPTPAPAPCALRALSFRPDAKAHYRTQAEQHHDLYETTLSFTPAENGWIAVEREFSLNRPTPVQSFGDLAGAELRWRLDAAGTPLGQPEPTGGARPGYLENMTIFAFAPAGMAAPSTCVGTQWESSWRESNRTRAFHFRIEGPADGSGSLVWVHVEGAVVTGLNTWRIEGVVHVSIDDGITGGGDLHVQGPGAPNANDYVRRVRIERR